MVFDLCLTLIAEVGFAFILKVRDRDNLIAVALINCVTNPLINYILDTVLLFGNTRKGFFYLLIALLETGVVISEGMFYKHTLKNIRIRPMILSFLLNCASYLSGVAVMIVLK